MNARVPRPRDGIDRVGLVCGALIVVISSYASIASWGTLIDADKPQPSTKRVHSGPHLAPTNSPSTAIDADRARGSAFYTGRFDEVLAASKEENAVLLFRKPLETSPNVHAYFIVHLDGRGEPEFRLSSRRYTLGTTTPDELNTDDSRLEIARLERLVNRFHLVDQWLPFATFGSGSMHNSQRWMIRFRRDLSVDIRGGNHLWVRMAGAHDFVRTASEKRVSDLALPFISYEFSTEGQTAMELLDEQPHVCFYWTNPGSRRQKITCGDSLLEAGDFVSCEKGLCLLAASYGLQMTVVEERTGRILATGSVDGSILLSFAANDAHQVAISCAGDGGETRVVDLHTGAVQDRRDVPRAYAPTIWFDNRTLIAHESMLHGKGSLVRLSLDDENDFRVGTPWTIHATENAH